MAHDPFLLQRLIDLRGVLIAMNQQELGWIWSSSRHAVTYPNPELRASTQRRLDHSVGGLTVVYLFALFEEYFPRAEWSKVTLPDEQRLLAFRHIRHSVAHGFDGSRANTHAVEFDAVMASSSPIEAVESWDSTHLWLKAHAGLQLRDLLDSTAARAMVQVA